MVLEGVLVGVLEGGVRGCVCVSTGHGGEACDHGDHRGLARAVVTLVSG